MLDFLKKQANLTHTENGAVTCRSTNSHCLDLFAVVGALRSADDSDIIDRFLLAYAEDPDLAMKCLFYARDVRGGLGERRVFRVIFRWLAEHEPETVAKNLCQVAEYGRFDDILCLMDTRCEFLLMKYIKMQLERDLTALKQGKEVSLLAKWLPSVNASNSETVRQAKRIARAIGMTDAQYRKTLVALRNKVKIIENNLRERDYTFDYEKQPSKALYKYRRAFARNDYDRYMEFLRKVEHGEAKMHTGTLTPYDIVTPFFRKNVLDEERHAIDVTWNAQEDFTNGENALVVIDGSGSMYGGGDPLPAAVALSLGIYFAERNTGAFRNHFITFSENPQLVQIQGKDILDKVRYCHNFNEVANTNIQKVFELLLETAVKNRLPQKELPDKIYIISDMEFDSCAKGADMTNFQYAKSRFEAHGYKLPEVVFWNVQSRSRQQPVTMNEQGVVLVSGCSPRIFSMLSSGILSPYAFMMEVLGSERYEKIVA